MKRSWHEIPNICSLEQIMRKKAVKEFENKMKEINAPPKFLPQKVRVNSAGDVTYTLDSLPKDMIHLGGENFVEVSYFLGQTRVHVRKHICDVDGFYHPTKDGISLSPKVWLSFCEEIKSILHQRSSDKVFVIDADLCISKQTKDNVTIFVLQRFFQRKNLSMQFVPEHVVLKASEFAKLANSMNLMTDCLKEGLITYTLFGCITKELDNPNLDFKPCDDPDSDGFLQLIESLRKCLCVAITIKITELINCFGCRDHFEADFMHACLSKSRSNKFDEYFDQALFQINMKDVAKDIVQKNLNIDYDYVLGQQEFFDAVDIKGLFKDIEKMYVSDEEENESDDLIISCNSL